MVKPVWIEHSNPCQPTNYHHYLDEATAIAGVCRATREPEEEVRYWLFENEYAGFLLGRDLWRVLTGADAEWLEGYLTHPYPDAT